MEKGVKGKKKKKLGSYPYVSVILSITLALFVIGLFSILILQSHKLSNIIKEQIEVQVYMKRNVTEIQRIQVQKTLSTKPYTKKVDGQAQISFISRETAAETFIKETGEDFSELLGDNPLRDAYLVKIDPLFHDKNSMADIKKEVEGLNGVFEVVYVESLVESINSNVAKISFILLGLTVILLLTVVVLINNTIKLALFSQRFIIRSMQLVGATPGFIQKPFLSRAVWHGLLAGFLASAALYGLFQYANDRIEGFADLLRLEELIMIYALMMILGAVIGLFSTYRAINKYLKLSLDELY